MGIVSYAGKLSQPDFQIESLISDLASNFPQKKTVKIFLKKDFCSNLVGFLVKKGKHGKCKHYVNVSLIEVTALESAVSFFLKKKF